MKGYVIIDTEIIEPEEYSEFVEQSAAAIAANGGRFLVRSSDIESFQGGWEPKRFVIVEFDNFEAAKGFLYSDEYGALDEVRRRVSNSRIVVVEGYDPGS